MHARLTSSWHNGRSSRSGRGVSLTHRLYQGVAWSGMLTDGRHMHVHAVIDDRPLDFSVELWFVGAHLSGAPWLFCGSRTLLEPSLSEAPEAPSS